MSSISTSNKRKRSDEPEELLPNPVKKTAEPIAEHIDHVESHRASTTIEEPTTTPKAPTVEPDEHNELEEPTAEKAKLSAEDKTPASDIEEGEISDEEQPPLPNEAPLSSTSSHSPSQHTDLLGQPPLPTEPLPTTVPPNHDDGWEPIWDSSAQAYYFYNRFTQKSQWDNPRILVNTPNTTTTSAIQPSSTSTTTTGAAGRYNPAIHGDYDPTADYAQTPSTSTDPAPSSGLALPSSDPSTAYATSATFNRFTGRFQSGALAPENFNDENKSRRQMNAFFDVDHAANSHGGKSLKAERQGQKLSKKELKEVKEKQRKKKEVKQRAWLMD